jgi:hypothetical protein
MQTNRILIVNITALPLIFELWFWQMYRSMKGPKNINVLIPMKKHLQAERTQLDDMGISSIFSSQR